MIAVGFALIGALSQALASVLHRQTNVSARDGDRSVVQTIRYLIRRPMWLLGTASMGATFAFTALALYFGQLATVQPILVTELIFTLALRSLFLHHEIAARTWGAAALVSAGLVGFLVVARPQEGHGTPTVQAWIVALSTRGAVIALLVVLSRRGSPARRAALLGASAGLVWAIDAAFVKAATVTLAHDGWGGLFLHWPVYAVVVTGVGGTFLLEAAFTAGPLSASQSALLIVDPLASIVIGIELFGERLANSTAAIALEVVALVAMFAGVVLLSIWAPPTEEIHIPVARAPRGTRTTQPAD